jgi:hypothetical protein
MVTFTHDELSDPFLLDRSYSQLRPEYRAAIRGLLSRPDESFEDVEAGQLQGNERIYDGARGRRMLELMRVGLRKNPAALRACIEDPEGASEDACRTRVVRKYMAGRFI